MIVLHRLGHNAEEFHLNPDLIVTVEATPDSVVTLTTGTKIVVVESPERVASEVRAWRSDILREALARPRVGPARPGERPALSAIDGDLPDSTENSPRPADHPER